MVTTTFCVSGMAILSAGSGANTILIDGTSKQIGSDFIVDRWIVQQENLINDRCNYNFTTAYAALDDATKFILEETAAELTAIKIIKYDMSGYTSRFEAESMINVSRDTALRNLSILKDKKRQKFISDPTTGSL